MKVWAIVPSAGSGERMKGNIRKQFIDIGGKPVLAHALLRLSSAPEIEGIIVVVHPDDVEYCREKIVGKYGIGKVYKVVEGGATRQESVALGFGHVPGAAQLVLTHDGARPFVTLKMINDVSAGAHEHGAAVTAVRAVDTLKNVKDGFVSGAIRRQNVIYIQTPQCFRYAILGEAIDKAERGGEIATDESSLVGQLGVPVKVVEGSATNIKITTADDLALAEALLAMNLPW